MLSRYVIEQAIELAMATNNVPCLVGYTGVGKTDIGHIIAKKNDRKVVELNLALQSTEDLIGYPYRGEDGKMHWAAPAWFPDEENKYIIYADEINRAIKDVVNAIMPMLLTGKLHEHILPKGTWIMTAMNPDTEDFDMVYSFEDAAIMSRLIFIEVPSEFSSWKTWLRNNNKFDSSIVSFIETNTDHFVPPVKNIMPRNIRPNPRSWTKFIEILHYCKTCKIQPLEALDIIAMGLLGEKVTLELATLMHTYFDEVDFNTLFDYDLEDSDAMFTGKVLVQHLNAGKELPNIAKVAQWFKRNAKTHPTIIRNILCETNMGLSDIYLNQDFLDAVAYITSH